MLAIVGFGIFVGVLLWAVNNLPFVDSQIKKLIYISIVVLTMIFVLNYFGMMPRLK